MSMTTNFSRRTFLSVTAAGAAHLLIPRGVRAGDVNGKLRLAAIGTGNKGGDDLREISASPRVDVAAICDIDSSQPHLGWAAEKFPNAARYADYRRLFDKPDSFDAVSVSTPDHMHAPIALAAMELGKHVFCQKPLAHSVEEARKMRKMAERQGVVTQMGNQIQSHHHYRTAVRLLRDGAIGKVREVHSWQAGGMGWRLTEERPAMPDPVPDTVSWDLWLGVAPRRPYKAVIYHPYNWRAWQDFSSGQLGDFGCHILDPVCMGLELTSPVSVIAEAPPLNDEVWTTHCKVSYRFPGTAHTVGPVVPVFWYDGQDHVPNRAILGLPESCQLPGSGSVLVGEAGTMIVPHWNKPQLFPEDKFRDYPIPQLDDVNHYTSWAHACLGDGTTTSHFGYSGPLTETVLLGALAVRFPGEQLQWNALQGRVTNHPAANAFVAKEYRTGW